MMPQEALASIQAEPIEFVDPDSNLSFHALSPRKNIGRILRYFRKDFYRIQSATSSGEADSYDRPQLSKKEDSK